MPTKFPRIMVTCDDELSAALARVEALGSGRRPARARLLHDLAVRGAAALVAEESARAEALERLAAASTREPTLFDRDVLDRVDSEAWGYESDAG